jgi:UDP-3-O-[3-hydroxymyristoyl] glucosamine N-acyltransferase
MTEPLFASVPSPISLAEIVAMTGAQLQGGVSPERRIGNVAPLELAGPNDLAIMDNSKFVDQLAMTRAGACLITERFERQAPPHVALLRSTEPYKAFVAIAGKLFAGMMRPSSLYADAGHIAPGVQVHPTARLEEGVTADPGVVIGPHAEIGAGTVLAANAVIGPSVRIGRNCAIGAGASITHAIVGDNVIIHPGCRIGQDGFGYVMSGRGHTKVPQVRRVIIQDGVEIGAGTTIDRGAFRDTVIGEGTKIDNLVQIAHNVTVGRHCVLVAQVGIAGSAVLEDFVVLGAKVGVIDHATIGEGAQIAACSNVHANVPAGARWGGTPAKPLKQWFREMMTLERLTRTGDAQERHSEAHDAHRSKT